MFNTDVLKTGCVWQSNNKMERFTKELLVLKAVCVLLLQLLIILPAKAAGDEGNLETSLETSLENRALEVVLNNGTEEVFKKTVPLSEMKAGFEVEEVSHQSPFMLVK
ncbi:hypothetical protein [Aliamphritea spongicola]|nr:hypothetical protein [Aliamphritea spongicola]